MWFFNLNHEVPQKNWEKNLQSKTGMNYAAPTMEIVKQRESKHETHQNKFSNSNFPQKYAWVHNKHMDMRAKRTIDTKKHHVSIIRPAVSLTHGRCGITRALWLDRHNHSSLSHWSEDSQATHTHTHTPAGVVNTNTSHSIVSFAHAWSLVNSALA